MLQSLTHECFSPQIGTTFVAHHSGENSYPLRLDAVKEKPRSRAPDGNRDPFSLLFSGPGPNYLVQGTYCLSHPAMGEMEVFVVPVGERSDGFVYQVVFS